MASMATARLPRISAILASAAAKHRVYRLMKGRAALADWLPASLRPLLKSRPLLRRISSNSGSTSRTESGMGHGHHLHPHA